MQLTFCEWSVLLLCNTRTWLAVPPTADPNSKQNPNYTLDLKSGTNTFKNKHVTHLVSYHWTLKQTCTRMSCNLHHYPLFLLCIFYLWYLLIQHCIQLPLPSFLEFVHYLCHPALREKQCASYLQPLLKFSAEYLPHWWLAGGRSHQR